jgi:SAM-dependent methyltransferase
MPAVVRADNVKPNYEELKVRWAQLLSKYYLRENELDPAYLVAVPCAYCASEKISSSFNLNGFVHNRCLDCETLYVSPRLNDRSIEELYSDEYYNEVYTRSMLPVFEKRKALIGVSKFKQVLEHWGGDQIGKVLDIGAGVGEVTGVFKDNGWETHAIEMNPVAVDWLAKQGHDKVFHGMLNDYVEDVKFDIIMAWGVVEHVTDPDAFLENVNSLLKPGGLFVSEVPHGNCLLVDMTEKTGMDPKRILMGEQHIVLYSIKAYCELHKRNGFENCYLQTNGLDVDTICKEGKVDFPDLMLASMQECIDEKLYGDLLRGFWKKT